jgi:hypothetical protein
MSTVVIDVDNQYCDDLMYSYQLILEDDSTYSVYVSRDVLRGSYEARGVESFSNAFQELVGAMKQHEGELA